MTTAEATTKNFEAIYLNTKTAREMALTAHNLSANGKYARTTQDGALYIWSDRRAAWVKVG